MRTAPITLCQQGDEPVDLTRLRGVVVTSGADELHLVIVEAMNKQRRPIKMIIIRRWRKRAAVTGKAPVVRRIGVNVNKGSADAAIRPVLAAEEAEGLVGWERVIEI